MWQCLVKCQNMNGLSLNYYTKSIATPTINSLKMTFFLCISFLWTASIQQFTSPIIATHVLYITLIAYEQLLFCTHISYISLLFKTFNSFEDLFMSTVYNVYDIQDLTLIQIEKSVPNITEESLYTVVTIRCKYD